MKKIQKEALAGGLYTVKYILKKLWFYLASGSILLDAFFPFADGLELFWDSLTIGEPSLHVVLHLCHVLHADRQLCDLSKRGKEVFKMGDEKYIYLK